MKTNPGGRIAPAETLGRDDLIASLWKTLSRQSVYMNDLRRMGKTQLMVKMAAEVPSGWVVIKRDLEGAHTAEEFATFIYRDALKALPRGTQVLASMSALLGKVSGAEIAGVVKLPDQSAAPWKEVFNRTLADLNAHMGREKKLALFMWDEVPYLLDNVSQTSAERAREILDVLRAASQEYENIRFLLTGSIGLHHVLARLEKGGYAGSPLNGMHLMRVGPLSPEHGQTLAAELLLGDDIQTGERGDEVAMAIATAVGNVPYYVHKVISRLPKTRVIVPEEIEALVLSDLSSTSNDWDLEHYRKRITLHFSGRTQIALALLDALATSRGLPFGELERLVRSGLTVDTEEVREVLGLLAKDHYVTKVGVKYEFYLEIVRRFWLLSRDLDEAT